MQNAGVTGAAQAAIATHTLSYLTLFGAIDIDSFLRLSPSKPEVQVSLPLVLRSLILTCFVMTV
ncbi:MAG: hypothetical protein WBV73_30700 [Phormidium sp.]